ncbi:gliotoxin biosynthesis protein GliK [Metarhizium album ARSEF 1941]|uniref:gamma-glutamylcyclotransferase n=1 Tax=Metarhizium album (strain ARSEF 1941) TaxID=1081103 RepID=A0A0B2WS98_METAS|nr:gliotoxin biosynthesis protein GliK [Metarhizium album ARSEF 1941]KHN98951.1 gliotoxin biosynthesis protein GliK [Metarhizium album ARSEF 1941]
MPPLANVQSAALAALDEVRVSTREPARGSYPSIVSVSTTSPERLAKVFTDDHLIPDASAADTVLYLAYGSNMCAKTFLGVRGIRPLSQVNVTAPSVRLTFDLAGVPYVEPCFANIGFRDAPYKTKETEAELIHQDMEWNGGLIGVVYEVTQEDYRTILSTEGAGYSYKEIVVPCYPIAPKNTVPNEPTPFLARTLYAANKLNEYDERKWWQRVFDGRQRPDPNYAQASLRYLNLLRDGGREHNLPTSYQQYLASLHPYIATRWTQKVGRYFFMALWSPLLIFFLMARFLSDERGQLPPWLASCVSLMFNMMWMSYDAAFKPIFGDGERTEEDERNKLLRDAQSMDNGRWSV